MTANDHPPRPAPPTRPADWPAWLTAERCATCGGRLYWSGSRLYVCDGAHYWTLDELRPAPLVVEQLELKEERCSIP